MRHGECLRCAGLARRTADNLLRQFHTLGKLHRTRNGCQYVDRVVAGVEVPDTALPQAATQLTEDDVKKVQDALSLAKTLEMFLYEQLSEAEATEFVARYPKNNCVVEKSLPGDLASWEIRVLLPESKNPPRITGPTYIKCEGTDASFA